MDIMVNTTISISKEFQSWLRDKGKKGESYEGIIKGLLKPEALKDFSSREDASIATTAKETVAAKKPETNGTNEEDDMGQLF